MKLKHIIYILSFLFVAVSCEKDEVVGGGNSWCPEEGYFVNYPVTESRNVLLLYSVGFNNLSSMLADDIKDIKQGWLPEKSTKPDVMLVYSHSLKSDYNTPNSPVLYRLYSRNGVQKVDTLAVYGCNTISASAEQLNNVLTYVKKYFPAETYGMIFSSHATGYLPAGYYTSPIESDFSWSMSHRFGHGGSAPRPVPYVEPFRDPSLPSVKSIGQDNVGPVGQRLSYEMELVDFAAAIPMRLDYLLFDACLMGGVEVAYQLRNKCGVVGFSPTEVLSEGFDYTNLVSHLLSGDPDPQAVCEDYYNQYESKSDVYKSATISLVDCSKIEGLAEVCQELFDRYGDNMDMILPLRVQQYYTYSYHWFYDLESVVVEAAWAERNRYEDREKDLKFKMERCAARVASLEASIEEERDRIETLDPSSLEYDALLQLITNYTDELSDMMEEYVELEAKLGELNVQMAEFFSGWDDYYHGFVEDLERLRSALDDCIIYKAATESFLGQFDILTYSGLSMYLPCNGGENLDTYYKTLDWNIRTGLVE